MNAKWQNLVGLRSVGSLNEPRASTLYRHGDSRASRLLEEAVGEHAFVSGGIVVYDFVEQNALHARHEEADNICVERP